MTDSPEFIPTHLIPISTPVALLATGNVMAMAKSSDGRIWRVKLSDLTPIECTHGGDCLLHPDASAPHNYDENGYPFTPDDYAEDSDPLTPEEHAELCAAWAQRDEITHQRHAAGCGPCWEDDRHRIEAARMYLRCDNARVALKVALEDIRKMSGLSGQAHAAIATALRMHAAIMLEGLGE